MSISIVLQIFNKIKNGNMIGGNLEKHNDSRGLLEQYKTIFQNNFEIRLANHKINYSKIMKMMDTGDAFWLDLTDFSFEELYQKIQNSDKSIKIYQNELLGISPQLHCVCNEFIDLDYKIFKLCENSRIMDIQIYEDLISFPYSYNRLIEILNDAYIKVMDDFDTLLTK